MNLGQDVIELVRDPHELMHRQLTAPPAWQQLAVVTILPLIAVRSIAVLLRSVVTGRPVAGMVLGVSSFALQVGCLIALAFILPTVVRQFRGLLADGQSLVLATYASVPLWIAGCLYLAPEEPALVLLVTRAVVVVAALWGLYLLNVGLEEVEVTGRHLIVATVAGAYLTLYIVLFALLGISSHIMLFVLGN